ncbi:MAG: type III pantothenate kinase [bacterium]
MLLAVDVGNTHTVLGVYEEGGLRAHWRVATAVRATEDEMWVMLRALLHEREVRPADLDAVVIASVVPVMTDALKNVCVRYLATEPLLVEAHLDLGMEIRVDPPASVGADRLANAVAAREYHGRPAVVVDLGTATTFDVIGTEGDYLGGIIAPGVYTAAEDLFRRAAKLAKVEILPPLQAIGRSTSESLRAGLFLGNLAMVDGLLERIRGELEEEPAVVFTGGLSTPFKEAFEERGRVDPFLTLGGLQLIHARIRGAP